MEPGAHQTGVWDRPKGPKIDPNLGVYFRVSGGPKTRSYPIVTFRLYDAKPEVPDLDRFWTHFGSENGSNLTPKSLFLDPFWGSYSRRWPSWPSQADGAARQGIRGATRPRFPYHGSGGGSGVQVGNRPALRVPNGVRNRTPFWVTKGSRPQNETSGITILRGSETLSPAACHWWLARCNSGLPKGQPLYTLRCPAFHQSDIARRISNPGSDGPRVRSPRSRSGVGTPDRTPRIMDLGRSGGSSSWDGEDGQQVISCSVSRRAPLQVLRSA